MPVASKNGWRIGYQLTSSQVLAFLLSHGIEYIIAFPYAHKPGIASELNRYEFFGIHLDQ